MKRCRHRRVFLVVALLIAVATSSEADPRPVSSKARTLSGPALERLTNVGKLWGEVRYLHPSLAYRDIDWDRAFVDAVPKVTAARAREDYRRAVDAMLAPLGDPLTRVIDVRQPTAVPSAAPLPPVHRWIDHEGGTLLVNLGGARVGPRPVHLLFSRRAGAAARSFEGLGGHLRPPATAAPARWSCFFRTNL